MQLVRGPSASFIFSVAQGLRLALYKGLHATKAKPVQKGGCRAGPDNRALRVELAEMLNIPLVLQLSAISDLQMDCAKSGDSYYPVRAFPLRRQLVCTLAD